MAYPIPVAYPVDGTIPNVNNDPALDAPIMMSNTANLISYVTVDHVAPGATQNGFHKQVSYNAATVPGTVTDPLSVGYTNNAQTMAEATGSASAVVQQFYRNFNSIFPVSAIRAFGIFVTTSANGAVIPTNAFNVVSITGSGFPNVTPKYRIIFGTGVLVGNNAVVLVIANSSSGGGYNTYSLTNPNLDLLMTNTAAAGVTINFLVIQI